MRLTAVVLVGLTLLLLMLPSAAQARTIRICAERATLHDTPRGFVVARLFRRDRVLVLRRSAERGWTNVRIRSGVPGWILTRSLCRG